MPAPPTTSVSLPRQAGGFLLVRELGRGGMGVVYEAHESASGRTVALKVLAADLAFSHEAFERFKREARLAAAISDSRCVFVYGAHEIEGSPAISMELVGGETLQERIARKEDIPIDTAVRWTLDLIDGLEAAHRSGILHRDVKPSNCFVTTDGRVKVGDFGLSRSLERDIQLTQSGQFLGSPLYASPEQVRGREVEERSDQYSCAATLYALLTGVPPFTGTNVGEVLARILTESPVRPRSIRAAIPEELERAVLKALEREPARRFKDLGALREALQPFAGGQAARASIPRRFAAWAIDMTILTMLGSAIGTRIQANALSGTSTTFNDPWLAISPLVQLALGSIPIVYFSILEGFFGASLGKWLLGLRVTTLDGGRARARATLRSLVYESPGLISAMLLRLFTNPLLLSLAAMAAQFLTFALRCMTMRKANGWRMLHEFASGTRTVQIALPFQTLRRVVAPPELKPAASPGLPATLGGYRIEGQLLESQGGRVLGARDAQLERSVWIQLRERGSAVDEARRGLVRAAKLRWLESLDAGSCAADVFEAPGGSALATLAQPAVQLPWVYAERALSQLVDELNAAGLAEASVAQLWIDRDWNLRVLDEPICGSDSRPQPPRELLGEAAQLLVSRDGSSLPQDLPLRAEPFVRRLIGIDPKFETLEEVRAALLELRTRPSIIHRRHRAAQIAVGAILPMVMAVIVISTFAVMAQVMPHSTECQLLVRELREKHIAGPGSDGTRTPLDAEGVKLRQLALAWELGQGMGPSLAYGISVRPENIPVIEAAREAFPAPDETTARAALEEIHAQRKLPKFVDDISESFLFMGAHGFLVVGCMAAAGWTLWACVFALIFPGGLTLRLFGFSLRARDGQRTSRARGLLRSLLAGLPLVAGFGSAIFLATLGHELLATSLGVATAIAAVVGVAASMWRPTQSPIDRLLGTRLVPR